MVAKQHSQDLAFAQILDNKFSATIANEDYSILRSLKALHPGENTRHIALLDNTTCPQFPLSGFLNTHGIRVEIVQDPLHELVTWDSAFGAGTAAGLGFSTVVYPGSGARTDKGKLVPRLITGSMKFSYDGTDFLVYKVSWWTQGRLGMQVTLLDLVFEVPEAPRLESQKDGDENAMTTAGHKLISDVYRWAGALKDEMWVFQDGQWSKDKALWAAIRDASWDDIVLEDEFLEGLRRDTRTFFENRQIYKDLGVVWKRGLLLLGPPGNGKTESIKVLLRESGQTALYVKSFTTHDGPEHGVRRIFEHARANAPCILVIEDLDSLVTANVRSFFLNELDGIGHNEGILTIATTNHPERIDDAILNRPSRFDVKYSFELPTEKLRATYALKWIRKITALKTAVADQDSSSEGQPIVKFEKKDPQLAEEVAKETGGWSFAFLKELFVSFLLRIAHDKARAAAEGKEVSPTSALADAVLMEQIKALSSQIVKTTSSSDADENEKGERPPRQVVRAVRMQAMGAIPAHSGTNF